MIGRLQDSFSKVLPLSITSVEYNDPMVTFAGPDWSVIVACPWRLTQADVLICAWGDEQTPHEVGNLLGKAIVAVEPQAKSEASQDPAFEISEGFRLEIFADTDLDPWVIRVGDLTYVGCVSGR